MARKVVRDPAAPKRNLSAYLLFQNGMRNEFKARNPGMTFGQLSKYTSAMYSELTPSEKDAWQQRAEQDKARYLHELSLYVPPPGYDARGDPIINQMAISIPVSGKKVKCRDPNAPKRNLSAYLLYQNFMRNTFKNENPGMTFGQLAKYTSHMYKSLTPQERAVWDTRSQEDKTRFINEMNRYVPTPGFDSQGNLIENVPVSTSRRQKKPKDPNAPKRARGSYVFFTFDARPKIMAEFPNVKFVEMGAIMGERWRSITPEEKAKYEAMANEDRERFNREMEAYNASKSSIAMTSVAPLPVPQHGYHQAMMPPQAYMDGGHVQHYGSMPHYNA